ncbi:MAG: P1 family peptidase [Thermomicrobiales bacterium]|nr:P1 family peptidase [Thermomicrobiales bacterium]MCO5229094.1 P1 family peptidase [Thermomicrobiales bacterium]
MTQTVNLPTGVHNAITDVPGIRIGQVTVREEGRFNTGVTAIVPDALPIPAAVFAGNGYGKLIGVTQIQELGELETPILLTGTLSAFRVADHLVSWMLQQPGNERMTSVNPVVGETNDGYLSDIRARPITEEHVFTALRTATTGPVAQGCVGAGAGTSMCGFKGGIGTSSRIVTAGDSDDPDGTTYGPYTVGALVQTNFGGTLVMDGTSYSVPTDPSPEYGSCMIVVATDAPLDARQLERIARRAVFAMARVGASYSHGSGDYAIAISTRTEGCLPDAALSPMFTSTMDAVESALLNSVLHAETTHGPDGHVRRSFRDCYPGVET